MLHAQACCARFPRFRWCSPQNICPARSLSQSHIVQWGVSVTIPVFVMSGGDGARFKAALVDGARLRMQALLEPWQGETGGGSLVS